MIIRRRWVCFMLLDVAFGLLEVKKVKARRQRKPKRKGRKTNHSR